MPKNEKDSELDDILTEINTGIKKSKNKKAVAPNKTAAPVSKELPSEEIKPSFIESVKVVEEEHDADTNKDEKLIEVAEITEEKKDTASKAPKPPATEKKHKENPEPISRAELKRRNGTAVSRSSSGKGKTISKSQGGVAILGVLITIFVIIGLVSTIWTGVKFTSDIINETSLKEELAQVIFPLVIVDIPEFETPEMLDSTAIVSSSIWGFIIDEDNKSKYKKDDLGSIYVPDVDIEKYVRSLYGSEVKIVHQSVDDSNVQMIYNSESKYYVIESTPKFLPYTPRVDKIAKSGDTLKLTVSYILPDAMWNMNTDKKSETVDKIMEYTLKKTIDSYQVLSVKLIEVTNNSQNMAETTEDVAAMLDADQAELDEMTSAVQ